MENDKIVDLALKYLSETKKTKYRIAKDTGLSEAGIGRYINGKSIPTVPNAKILVQYFENELPPNIESNASLTEIDNYMEVAIFPSKAKCGDFDEYTDDKFYEDWEKQLVIVDKQYKGTYILFDIEGDSMDDGTSNSLLDGDRVLGRQVPTSYWQDKLFYKKWKYFAILVKGSRPIIKQVTYHNTNENYILCHSLNPMFEDLRVDLKDVVGIFNIVDQVSGKSKFRA